jgi:hypothetical protein
VQGSPGRVVVECASPGFGGVKAGCVSEASASIWFSTWPSRWNSSSVRNRSRFSAIWSCLMQVAAEGLLD